MGHSNQVIDYDRICRIAKFYSLHLPPRIDWRDLAQESALGVLQGRMVFKWAMTDLLRRDSLIGVAYRKHYSQCFRRVPMQDSIRIAAPNQHVILTRLQHQIDALPSAHRRVLRMRYWEGMHNSEIASQFGVNPSRIAQIHTAAIQKLRESIQ